MRRCRIEAVFGVRASRPPGAKNCYVADNVIQGITPWTSEAMGADGKNVGEGVEMTGPGNVICFNRVSGFRDCISTMESQFASNQVCIDIYHNDIAFGADDAIEADYAMGNCRILRNRINDLAVLKPLVGPDVGSIQKLEVDGKDAWLLFPAKLYCGQSLLDGRRESIIIDYAFTDDLPGYREKPDALAGRDGFEIRDEIRMVRPGFYLGRAYIKRVFVLNFTLYNKEAAEKDAGAFQTTGTVQQDCWVGPQRTAMMK